MSAQERSEESEQRLALLKSAEQLVRAMAASPGVEDILRIVVLRMATMFEVERVSVLLFQPGDANAFVVMERDNELSETVALRITDYPELQEIIASKQPLLIPDLDLHGEHSEIGQRLRDLGATHRAAVLFPLLRKSEVVGALYLKHDEPLHGVGRQLLDVGSFIASVTAVALGAALDYDSLLVAQRELVREKELAQREVEQLKRLEDIFEQARDGIALLDSKGRIRYANHAAAALLRQDVAELETNAFADLVAPESASLIKDAVKGDVPEDYVDLVMQGDPHLVVSAAMRRFSSPFGLLVNFRDVTKPRAIEEELRKTRDFLENLIQSSVDAIVAADDEGKVMLCNRAAEKVLGYKPGEMHGTHVRDIYPDGIAERVMRSLRSQAFGGPGRLEMTRLQLRSRAGEIVPVSLTAAIIYEGQKEAATVGVFTDLRERLQMEEKLHHAQAQLQQSERKAVAMELAGAAAHELNQPLTSILGYAELLKRKVPEDDPKRRAIDTIARETERMATIVRRLGEITSYRTKPYVGGSKIMSLENSSSDITKPS